VDRKNLLKAFYALLTLDLRNKTNLIEVERIASYSERYSLVYRVMEPLKACFNRMILEYWNSHDRFHWTEEAKLAILMWRATMYLATEDEQPCAKNLWSLRKQPVRYIMEIDGSLKEVSFLLFKRTETGEVCLGGGAVDLTRFGFGTNSG
jgi:hypothetical protein